MNTPPAASAPSTRVSGSSETAGDDDEQAEEKDIEVTLATHREIQEEIDAPLREGHPPPEE